MYAALAKPKGCSDRSSTTEPVQKVFVVSLCDLSNCPETRALSTSSTEARKDTDLNNGSQYGSIQGPEDAASESGYTCLIFLDVSWVWVLSLSVLSVNGSYHHLNTQPLPA